MTMDTLHENIKDLIIEETNKYKNWNDKEIIITQSLTKYNHQKLPSELIIVFLVYIVS